MARKAHPYFGFINRNPTPPPSAAKRSPHEPGLRPEDQEGALWDRVRGGMAIEITYLGGDRYTAAITPPTGIKPFKIARPSGALDLMGQLLALGCHPADIGDALEQANPNWTRKS